MSLGSPISILYILLGLFMRAIFGLALAACSKGFNRFPGRTCRPEGLRDNNRDCAPGWAGLPDRAAPLRKGFGREGGECDSAAPASYRPPPQSTRALRECECAQTSLPWPSCTAP